MDELATRDDEVVAKRTAARATRRARGGEDRVFSMARDFAKKTIQRWALRVVRIRTVAACAFGSTRAGSARTRKKAPPRAARAVDGMAMGDGRCERCERSANAVTAHPRASIRRPRAIWFVNALAQPTTRPHGAITSQTMRATQLSSRTAIRGGDLAAKKTRRGAGAGRATYARRSSAMTVTKSQYSVAVLGAAGGIGQSLSLLLKMNPLISDLRLYDLANTPGVAADLSHTNTTCQVRGFMGADQLKDALKGADLVVIPAGVPRKPGMTRDDLFAINAGIVRDLCAACTEACPNALINIISNPVNSTVPIASEVFKKAGCYDPKKIFGVTTLDIVRSNTFVAEAKGLDINDVDVPVIGGHAGITILPLLSQTYPKCDFTAEEADKLTVRIQNAGTEVVEAKAGAGSATLSMAYAAARMAEACLRGLSGEPDVYECSYVASNITELPYFATKVRLGPSGAEEVMPIGDITEYEADWLAKLKVELTGSIQKGVDFANQ